MKRWASPLGLFGCTSETIWSPPPSSLINFCACQKSLSRTGTGFSFTATTTEPMHIHVRYGSGEAVFDVERVVELRESQGLKVRELAKAEELATLHRALIIQRWHEHFDR